jgi:predicted AlkP superfamily phosphohydrolase/phosphomutase
VAAGQLPHFGNLLDRGAVLDLATLKPTQAEPVWTAAATGKYPPRSGVRSDAVYQTAPAEVDPVDLLPDYCFAYALVYQGFVQAEPLTSASVLSRPLWDILADYGLASGIVGWPLTYPARADRGYIVSDAFDEAASSPLRLSDAQAADPTTAVELARNAFDRWQAESWRDLFPASSPEDEPPEEYVRAAWDHAYSEAAALLEQQFAPRLTAVRYEGLDTFGHAYLRESQPERFGELRGDEPSRLDQYYAFIDGEVGRAAAQLAPGDLLLVVSGFGMEPMSVPKRWLARLLGQPDFSGTHEPAPDGFLIAYGSNVAAGQFPRGAIVDLAPTVLYYMGLDVGRDMDGFARTDLFLRTFTHDRPVSYVQTHDR